MQTTKPRLSNWNLINHILNHPGLSTEEKFVAVTIAIHRNTSTGACYPSQRTIATLTGLPKSTVLNRIRTLKQKRVLTVTRMNHKFKAPAWYRFTYDEHVLIFMGPKT